LSKQNSSKKISIPITASHSNALKKTYVLDTNVLLSYPRSIFTFDEHNVCVCDTTLEEIDNNKTKPGETGANAREAARLLDKLRETGSLIQGVALGDESGAIFKIETNHITEPLPDGWDAGKPDHRILRTCKALQKTGDNVVLVTNDTVMRLKADVMGVTVDSYRTDRAPDIERQYKGRSRYYVEPGGINAFYAEHKLSPEYLIECSELTLNEYLILEDSATGNSALGRYDGRSIVPLVIPDQIYGAIPKNAGQRFMFDALMAPVEEAPLVVIKGGAGTAKTFCGLAAGLEQVVERNIYRKVLVVRPKAMFDDDIGFLKGGEMEKIAPLIRPIYDNLEALSDLKGESLNKHGKANRIEDITSYYFDYGYISAEALAFFRGRSINRTYILIDEAQNASPTQAFGIVTRPGLKSKVVMLGDPAQIDNPRLDSRLNGLSYTAERMKGSPLCRQITLENTECVRSPLVEEALSRMAFKGQG
jgi:PhoH-like ATPase